MGRKGDLIYLFSFSLAFFVSKLMKLIFLSSYCNWVFSIEFEGCDIIIHKDKGVSRTHAHLIVDEMTKSSQVRVKDLSKYGTFINKNLSSSKKVHDFHYKETSLEDGDLLSFGTGNATYRYFLTWSHVRILHLSF